MGIGFPVIVSSSPVRTVRVASGVDTALGGGEMMPPRGGFPRASQPARPGPAEADDGMIALRRYDFVVQFVWQPKTPGGPEPVAAGTSQREETDD